MNLIGMPSSSTMDTTTPPLEVPSSLVNTMPVTPTAALNPRACCTTFCPCVASTTRRISFILSGIFLSNTPLTFSNSFMRLILVCSRPDVSAINMSTSSESEASIASNMTAAGDFAVDFVMVAFERLAHSSSCRSAAARNVSPAASITLLPSAENLCASLPIDVVLPPPFTPTIINTAGLFSSSSRAVSPPRVTRISLMASFIAPRRSLGSFSEPAFTRSRKMSQIFADVPTPKSRAMRASSSFSKVTSASSRFQNESSSSMTPMSDVMLSRPVNRALVRSISALAFS
mmetsp:Transcript_14727/g.21440  ORF Transcript_14727/g.21440 Transcript_14727/m.21440 type:complete len:288 (-) Transcript_14727:300-1163(-)